MAGPSHDTPNDDNNNSKKTSQDQLPYKTTSEYATALNQWMVQCYYWQMFNQLNNPITLSFAALSGQQPATASPPLSNNADTRPLIGQNIFAAAANNVNFAAHGAQQRPEELGRVYIVPKVWKRITAELIDFLFLLVLKIMVTYVAIDYIDLVDLSKYEINLEEDFDAYQIAYELTSEILIIECVHRLLVIIFETFCLAKSQAGGNRVGGATPGKTLMGLKVVSCSQVDDMGNGTIRVTPAADMGFLWALVRALIKNLSSVFFLPASLTIFVSNHNRAAYDIACKCIVVEDIPINQARRRVN
jgi:uncharacterized RDD family membrane protein YckC